jgi:hypothetical protein
VSSPRPLGRLERVDVRDIWATEAAEFTPWLAEPDNIALLGEEIGIELECIAQEKYVGPFRADILCRDVNSDELVVIENQLERSDHGHLGQLLTYAAGLETASIVWLAPRFCAEHRSALDWLNKATKEQFRFFGVELEVWAISGSAPAPRFHVVSKPDGWNQAVRRASREVRQTPTQSAQRRLEYWQAFLAGLRITDLKIPGPNTLGNLWFNLKGRDLWITVYAAASSGRIGVFLRGKAGYYATLQRSHAKVSRILGTDADWYQGESPDDWSIAVAKVADPSDRSAWPAQHEWLAKQLERFIIAFRPFAAALD